MRFPWAATPPALAPLLARLLDSTPYAIAAAVVCVMLAIVFQVPLKRLAARAKVKRCGSYDGKVVAHRSACGAG